MTHIWLIYSMSYVIMLEPLAIFYRSTSWLWWSNSCVTARQHLAIGVGHIADDEALLGSRVTQIGCFDLFDLHWSINMHQLHPNRQIHQTRAPSPFLLVFQNSILSRATLHPPMQDTDRTDDVETEVFFVDFRLQLQTSWGNTRQEGRQSQIPFNILQ